MEYWDHVNEMKNAKDCADHGRYMARKSRNGKNVLDSSVLRKIDAKVEKAIPRYDTLLLGLNSRVRKYEQARVLLGGQKTTSAKFDPVAWGTAELPPKRNKWMLAGKEGDDEEEEDPEEEEEEDLGEDVLVASLARKAVPSSSPPSNSHSSDSSDSSDESQSSDESRAPVTEEVRQQRIANTRQFYALNRARWLSGDLDDETWEQFGCDEDSEYLN